MISSIVQTAGQVFVIIGLLITGFGVYAILHLDSFYARSVVTSKVEAMGFFTVIIGAMMISGTPMIILKLLILLIFELLTVSAGTHAIARSAWISGYRCRTFIELSEQTDSSEVPHG